MEVGGLTREIRAAGGKGTLWQELWKHPDGMYGGMGTAEVSLGFSRQRCAEYQPNGCNLSPFTDVTPESVQEERADRLSDVGTLISLGPERKFEGVILSQGWDPGLCAERDACRSHQIHCHGDLRNKYVRFPPGSIPALSGPNALKGVSIPVPLPAFIYLKELLIHPK